MNSPMAHDGFTIVNNQVINHEKEKEEGNLTGRNERIRGHLCVDIP